LKQGFCRDQESWHSFGQSKGCSHFFRELLPMTLSAEEVHRLKHAPMVDGVLPVVLERWSPRAFDGREVSAADLRRVFEAARWAPSSNNEQPWRFIVGLRGTETYKKIEASLVSFNQAWAPKAPVLILGVANTKFSRNGKPNNYASYDLGAATVLITLQAQELGLATHQMGGFDHEAARQALGIPEDYALGSVMALGYLGEPAALENEHLIEQEVAPRTRKPLNEVALAAWGEPLKLD
jgi:nitroreductase